MRGQSKSVAYVLLRRIILIFLSLSRREDYGRLYEFVCDKHLRIKDKGGKVVCEPYLCLVSRLIFLPQLLTYELWALCHKRYAKTEVGMDWE